MQITAAKIKPLTNSMRERRPETAYQAGRSLKFFGLLSLPTWNARTGHIINLASIIEAQRAAGETVFDVYAVDLSETQELAAIMAFNNHYGEWNWEKVSGGLKVVQTEIPLEITGFHDSDTGPLLAAAWQPAEKVSLADALAEPKQGALL